MIDPRMDLVGGYRSQAESGSTILAVNQPYFFPYVGYWQIIHSANKFVIYDDVSYPQRGWVNRNRILIGGLPSFLTIPLHKASQHKRICDIEIKDDEPWRLKMLRSIEMSYRKSHHFNDVFGIVADIVNFRATNLADFLCHQILALCHALDISTEIVQTSRIYENSTLKGTERIQDICRRNAATTYINLPGGRSLYEPKEFRDSNIRLRFLVPHTAPYTQVAVTEFVPSLSIIDTLMALGIKGTQDRIATYSLED